jgi:CDP-glucose 4,6-dehydratase
MSEFWSGKKVLLTGHTGFKGAWLTLMLAHWGAKIYGYALPPKEPSLYSSLELSRCLEGEQFADIADRASLEYFYRATTPDITIHMAAQALVLPAYDNPVETFRVNVLGTATLLDVLRGVGLPQTVIVVTTDKVYENLETGRAYTETDPLGAGDPYSASKACAELVTTSFRHSFWHDPASPIVVKTARAGNVIGAGDYSAHRLIPDVMRAIAQGTELVVRHPESVRPWQHVLEPLAGYLMLAEQTTINHGNVRPNSFNFGSVRENCWPVEKLVRRVIELWDEKPKQLDKGRNEPQPPEATLLYLDSSRAQDVLGWTPRWDIEETLAATIVGYKALHALSPQQARAVLTSQIEDYFQKS